MNRVFIPLVPLFLLDVYLGPLGHRIAFAELWQTLPNGFPMERSHIDTPSNIGESGGCQGPLGSALFERLGVSNSLWSLYFHAARSSRIRSIVQTPFFLFPLFSFSLLAWSEPRGGGTHDGTQADMKTMCTLCFLCLAGTFGPETLPLNAGVSAPGGEKA